jgi:hypothetical protein
METILAIIGSFSVLLSIGFFLLGILLVVIWTILPFYLLGLCHRVERMERFLAAIYQEMPAKQPLQGEME